GLVHVSELGSDYFQYNEASHELRGERTGIRYRLTDPVQVHLARADHEARRIEFRLVKGTSFKALTAPEPAEPSRRIKRAASVKPKSLNGTASQRRAEAKRDERKAGDQKARQTTKTRR